MLQLKIKKKKILHVASKIPCASTITGCSLCLAVCIYIYTHTHTYKNKCLKINKGSILKILKKKKKNGVNCSSGKDTWIYHFPQYQVFWKLLSESGPSTINVKRAALMENKCSWVWCVFTLSVKGSHAGRSWTRPLSFWSLAGPWPPKEECLGAQTLIPRFLGLLASAWLENGTARRRKISVPPSSSLLETFRSARSFSGVSAPTTWHWHWCGATAVKFSHLPRPGGWWRPDVDSLTESRLVPWFSHCLYSQFSIPRSVFLFVFLA